MPLQARLCSSELPFNPRSQVYVGNLPWTTTWQELKDQFRVAGNVTHADVATVR